ncbi:SatD family protein [Galbibacter pacificus]|uniref:SatD family protein n=1 Tax=Galbibacter pacificus TaxID=2996052 RepID=A0ABT6FPK2_9FLAO|nr:SatD family protein [Galbibacter pacificus]MDG3581516.1 SatD family protein [Galbibacter pacificus]MDG3584994.1 SatD family protein [Galbibacter pacificus]
MTSVITGDIISSRNIKNPEEWLEPLKKVFVGIASNRDWEIYRGDSFQIEIKDIRETFLMATLIKSTVKKIKELDVRMAIGIGEKTHDAASISESNGSAFIYSGEKFETLKEQKINLAIKTDHKELDDELNLYFKLALIAMDNWTKSSAEIVKISIENPNLSQNAIGQLIGIKQNTVSEHLKRASFDEIMELDCMYRKKIGIL